MCDFSGYDLRGDEMGESRPPRIKLVGYIHMWRVCDVSPRSQQHFLDSMHLVG
jgi:hypothetical protein